MIYFKLLLGLLIAWMLGQVIVCVFDRKNKMPLLERSALSYLIGQGAITLLLFLLFLLPIAHQSVVVTLLVAGLFALKLFFDKKQRWINPIDLISGFRQFIKHKKNVLIILLLVVLTTPLFIKISYSFIETCSKPEYSWDASGNWTGIGKNVYYAQKYRPDKVIGELRHETSYPRGISLMHYWLFSWMGEANDQWSKIIFPIELLCLLIVFYYGLKPIRGQLGALVFTCFLSSAPLLLYHSTIGYADLTKTVYFAVGIIYFYRWLQTKQNSYFWFFALPLAFTTWIKMEGKTLYAIGLVLLLFYLWHSCKESLKTKIFHAGQYLFLFIIIGLPWQLFVMFNQLPDPQSKLHFVFSKFFEFHEKMYTLMFMEGSWGLFWVIAAAALLYFFKRQIIGKNLYLFITILLFYGNLLFIYLCFYESVGGMVATFNRVLLPIYPVAVFNLGCVVPMLTINKEIKI